MQALRMLLVCFVVGLYALTKFDLFLQNGIFDPLFDFFFTVDKLFHCQFFLQVPGLL